MGVFLNFPVGIFWKLWEKKKEMHAPFRSLITHSIVGCLKHCPQIQFKAQSRTHSAFLARINILFPPTYMAALTRYSEKISRDANTSLFVAVNERSGVCVWLFLFTILENFNSGKFLNASHFVVLFSFPRQFDFWQHYYCFNDRKQSFLLYL